jgi:hypothetical protein
VRVQRRFFDEKSRRSELWFQSFMRNRDLRMDAPRSSLDGGTVLEQLTELYRSADAIDAAELARLFGVTNTWIVLRATKPKKGRGPRLVSKQTVNGVRIRSANNRLVFDLEDISTFVATYEWLVTRTEAPYLGGRTLPLVSATDPRIGTEWSPLEAFYGRVATRQHSAVRLALGTPIAFHICTGRRDYSALWRDEPRRARSSLAANDNAIVTIPTRHGATP